MRAVHRMIGAVAALALAGAVPAIGYAAEEGLLPLGFGDGSIEAVEEASSEAQEPQPIPGRALVLYRVGEQASSGARFRSASDEAAPLSDADFTVAETWDFSVVDEQADARPLSRSLGADSSDADGSAVPTGEDIRIALVERAGADPWDLVAELEQVDGVIAAQPSYAMGVASTGSTADTLTGWQYSLYDDAAGIDFDAVLEQQVDSDPDEQIVAVVDTGVDAANPDLADQMWHKCGRHRREQRSKRARHLLQLERDAGGHRLPRLQHHLHGEHLRGEELLQPPHRARPRRGPAVLP